MATLPSVRKTTNGCEVAVPVRREITGFRLPSQCIAAIDFGTTNCSLAYITTAYNPIEGPTRLYLNNTHYRVPTAILFKPDGTVDSFGFVARTKFSGLTEVDGGMSYAYFEQIKMNLQHDENVSRDLTIFASNGQEYYLLDVIAHILKYLKEQLTTKLKQANSPFNKASDFDWVITVPAIWRARGKQMMREAGYKAGLCSEDTCACLKDTRTAILPTRINERNTDKLSIILEPEAAVVYCENRRQYQQQLADKKAKCCVIVDIGGGTVDISAVKVTSSEAGKTDPFKVVHPPTGSNGGGSAVNENFLAFLKKLANDPELAKYTNPEVEDVSENRADLNELLNDTFEKQKALFTTAEEQPDELNVRLPSSFLETYHKDIDSSLADGSFGKVKRINQNLRISSSVMRGFFEPVVKGLVKEVKEVLDSLDEVDIIYLVGGFGGTTYIRNIIQEKFGREYTYCIPTEPEFAVVRGAVLLHQNPEIISTRRADATYGFETMIPFDKEIHCDEYRIRDRVQCKTFCDKIFATLVQRGDIVSRSFVYCTTVTPSWPGQPVVNFNIYSSYDKDIWYITGKRGKGDTRQPQKVYKLCSFDISLPSIADESGRTVELHFDFSHTEIQLRAYDTAKKQEVKAVVDFLSTDPPV